MQPGDRRTGSEIPPTRLPAVSTSSRLRRPGAARRNLLEAQAPPSPRRYARALSAGCLPCGGQGSREQFLKLRGHHCRLDPGGPALG